MHDTHIQPATGIRIHHTGNTITQLGCSSHNTIKQDVHHTDKMKQYMTRYENISDEWQNSIVQAISAYLLILTETTESNSTSNCCIPSYWDNIIQPYRQWVHTLSLSETTAQAMGAYLLTLSETTAQTMGAYFSYSDTTAQTMGAYLLILSETTESNCTGYECTPCHTHWDNGINMY